MTLSSLFSDLQKEVQNRIDNFIDTIASKYKLDKEELSNLFEVKKSSKPSISSLASVDTEDLSIGRLTKCSRLELIALCKANSKKCSGNKQELMDRLLERESNKAEKIISQKAVTKPKKASILTKLEEKKPIIGIKKNQWGNYEHPETRIVMDQSKGLAIGIQDDDGSIQDLTDESIQLCKKFKFNYAVPDNLGKSDTLDDVRINEIDDGVELDSESSDAEIEPNESGAEIEEEASEEEELLEDE